MKIRFKNTSGGQTEYKSFSRSFVPTMADSAFLNTLESFPSFLPLGNIINESKIIMEAISFIHLGRDYITYIYCYRNISISIPIDKVKPISENEKISYYENLTKVLEPKIDKMIEIKHFTEEATAFVVKNCFELFSKDSFTSDSARLTIIFLIDIIMSINFLVSFKSSLVNDFTRLKRENNLYSSNYGGRSLSQKINTLQGFFSSLNYTAENLREKFQSQLYFQDTLNRMLSHVFHLIECDEFLPSEERLSLTRVAFYTVYFMDSKDYDFFKDKNKNLNKLKKLCVRNGFLPLCMDCNIVVKYILRSCHNVRNEKRNEWIDHVDPETYKLSSTVEAHSAAIKKFTLIFKMKTMDLAMIDVTKKGKELEETLSKGCEIIQLFLQGAKKLEHLQTSLMRQNCFKLENRIKEEEFKNITKNKHAEEDLEALRGDINMFERKIRYNYTNHDLKAVIKAINLIKNLSSILMEKENLLVDYINLFYYNVIQEFLRKQVANVVVSKLPEPIKKTFEEVINFVKDIDVNITEQTRKKSIFAFRKKKQKEPNETEEIELKVIKPAFVQIYALEYAIGAVLHCASKRKGILQGRDTIKYWNKTLKSLSTFRKVADIKFVVDSESDLSFLWFKEFNLAFSGCIQFPIELSLPGILVDYSLQRLKVSHDILNIFDIYNDSGKKSLITFRQRYIYEEVEAECSLLFDKFLFKFTRFFVNEALNLAALNLYPNLEYSSKWPELTMPEKRNILERLSEVVSEKDLEILGRRINLNKLLTQQANSFLREILEYTIAKFEHLGIINVLELQQSLKIFEELCQTLRDKNLKVDEYQMIFEEVNESAGLCNFEGRIFNSIIYSLITDFCPNFVFKSGFQRFERTSWININEDHYKKLLNKFDKFETNYGTRYAKYYKIYFKIRESYISDDHFEALTSILSPTELSYLLNEVTCFGEKKLTKKIHPYFLALRNAIPIIKAPPATFGFPGAFTAIELKLKPIQEYPPLRKTVVQAMREFGNTLCLANCLDLVMESKEILNFLNTSHLYGIKFKTKKFVQEKFSNAMENLDRFEIPEKSKLEETIEEIANGCSDRDFATKSMEIVKSIRRYREFNEENEKKSYLAGMLLRYTDTVYKTPFAKDFQGQFLHQAATGLSSHMDIASILNAIKFVVSNSSEKRGEKDPFEVYGESFAWAMAGLATFCNQRNRLSVTDFCLYLHRLNDKDKEENSVEKKEGINVLKLSEQMKNFLCVSEKIQNAYDKASLLFTKIYKGPNRLIKKEGKEGKVEWVEDENEEKYLEKILCKEK